jgi:nicotinic acetylcholine receptor
MLSSYISNLSVVVTGIDLGDYYSSTEWDLLAVPAKKYEKYYPCCSEPFPDIKFNITIRRKTLFYTVNLILPCVAICSVTLLVFYIPANSGEKITMGITILNSLNIFLLLVAEINPPTSLATPLIGKYLLFTMVLVTCSIIVTVFVLNIHFRSPSTHVMSPWIRELFLNVLPRLLLMRRPQTNRDRLPKVSIRTCEGHEIREPFTHRGHMGGHSGENHRGGAGRRGYMGYEREDLLQDHSYNSLPPLHRTYRPPDTVMQAMIGVNFIADHLKQQDEFNRVSIKIQFELRLETKQRHS